MAYTREASINQRTQLGVETTAGVEAAANRRLPSLQIQTTEMAENKLYRPQGSKVDGVTALNQEWSSFDFDGNGTYNELPYILASILTKTGIGGSGVWTFQPTAFGTDIGQTYTIQHGSDTYATEILNALATACTISATRQEVKTTGSGIGKLLTTGITMTANPTMVGNVPVVANQLNVYYDTSFGAIGTTQLKAVYTWELSITNRFGPNWVLDNTLTSWKDPLELVPDITLKMKMMRNADNDIILTQMRANATGFLQLNAQGPSGYSIAIAVPVASNQLAKPEDLAGAYVIEWTFKPLLNSAFMAAKNGAFLEAVVINTLAAL